MGNLRALLLGGFLSATLAWGQLTPMGPGQTSPTPQQKTCWNRVQILEGELSTAETGTAFTEPYVFRKITGPCHDSRKLPLLVEFHRWGGSEYSHLNTDFHHLARQEGWHFLAMRSASTHHLNARPAHINTMAIIRKIANENNVDKDRIYGVGFSMGGTMALSLAAGNQDFTDISFAAIASLAGVGSYDHAYRHHEDDANPGPVGPWPFAGKAPFDFWHNGLLPALPPELLDFSLFPDCNNAQPWESVGCYIHQIGANIQSAQRKQLDEASVISDIPEAPKDFPNTIQPNVWRSKLVNLADTPAWIGWTIADINGALDYIEWDNDAMNAMLSSLHATPAEYQHEYHRALPSTVNFHSTENWNEVEIINFLRDKRLKRQTSGKLVMDRDARFQYFTVRKQGPTDDPTGPVFAFLQWEISKALNKLNLTNIRYLKEIEVDMVSTKLDLNQPLAVFTQTLSVLGGPTPDDTELNVILDDVDPPSQVWLNGQGVPNQDVLGNTTYVEYLPIERRLILKGLPGLAHPQSIDWLVIP